MSERDADVLVEDMRNRLIHAYFGVSLGIVWQTIQKALPQLSSSLKKL
jgi:uncharacterized protein with HEPN domain